MSNEDKAKDKLTRAKIKVLLKNPFFGTLLMYLQPVSEQSVNRVDTDGENLYYNPGWFINLTEDEIAAAICHTVLHCALGHLWRRGSREPQRWNKACDHVVNLILADEGYKIPGDMPADKLYRGKSAEEVYNLLGTKETGGIKKNNLQGDSGSDDRSAGKDYEPVDQHHRWEAKRHDFKFRGGAVEQLWKERVARAVQTARSRGDMPGALERAVGGFLYPEKNWRVVLAEFLTKIKSDYSWLPPDRRLVPYNILVPDLGEEEERLEDIVVAVDTSGSVDNSQLQRFLSEVRAITASFPTINGHLVFCDSKIQGWYNLTDFNNIIPRGGGGTDTHPVFREVEKRRLNPSALIYFTDGMTLYPVIEPDYPVLWVLTSENKTPPWGRKIIFK